MVRCSKHLLLQVLTVILFTQLSPIIWATNYSTEEASSHRIDRGGISLTTNCAEYRPFPPASRISEDPSGGILDKREDSSQKDKRSSPPLLSYAFIAVALPIATGNHGLTTTTTTSLTRRNIALYLLTERIRI